VLAAHDAAVVAALDWFQEHGGVTRRGTNGVHQVDARGLVAALFRQHTSREADPQLHTHAVIWGKVQDPTGKWLSLDARFLKYQQRSIGWVYAAALRSELSDRLGVSWGEVNEGHADIDGVPAGLLKLLLALKHCRDSRSAELAITEGGWSSCRSCSRGFRGDQGSPVGTADEPVDRGIEGTGIEGRGSRDGGRPAVRTGRACRSSGIGDGGPRAGGRGGLVGSDARGEPDIVAGSGMTPPATASTSIATTRARTITSWPPRPGPRAPACATTVPGC
jgi:TrwC relaxase